MSVGFSRARNPRAIPEYHLWRLKKGARVAEARTRMTPLGPELLIYVGGELVWSQVLRDGRDVGALSDERRQAFLGRGWSEPRRR